MTDIKNRMDRLDRKIQNLRPQTVTLDAAATYEDLAKRAQDRFATARSAGRARQT